MPCWAGRRARSDLDIVVQEKDLQDAVALLQEKDYRDVTALAEAFGLDLPAAFRNWPR